jgi:transposase
MSKNSRKYTRYTEDFKADAVRLVEVQGLSVAQVSRDLGINTNTLHNWVRKAREAREPELTESTVEELKRLRKEVAVLKEEREILKKAAAFFARESK